MSTTTLKPLSFEDATAHVDAGAVFVDLRDVQSYLDVHIPGSIELFYESGPGLASRARDCVPLEWPLVLLDLGTGDAGHAAASLRGKGFDVIGSVTDGLNGWAAARGTPASTELVRGGSAPDGVLLDVGDPGVTGTGDALSIPVERLWSRRDEIASEGPIVVAAGYGIRAALAVGLLERAGRDDIVFWKTRA
jgi:rhodanese-related sulfurtransferase